MRSRRSVYGAWVVLSRLRVVYLISVLRLVDPLHICILYISRQHLGPRMSSADACSYAMCLHRHVTMQRAPNLVVWSVPLAVCRSRWWHSSSFVMETFFCHGDFLRHGDFPRHGDFLLSRPCAMPMPMPAWQGKSTPSKDGPIPRASGECRRTDQAPEPTAWLSPSPQLRSRIQYTRRRWPWCP